MTALACIVNPLDPSALMVFASDGNYLEVYAADATTSGNVVRPEAPKPKKSDSVTPFIRNPSELVAFQDKAWISIYGIQDSDGTLSLFSPGLLPLGAKSSPGGALGGCSNGTNEAWLYYISGTSPNQVLSEYRIQDKSSSSLIPTDVNFKNTNFTAVFDPTSATRYYIYQNTDGDLIVMTRDDQNKDIPHTIPNVLAPTVGTPLGACCNPTTAEMVIYYLQGKGGELWRSSWNEASVFLDPVRVQVSGLPVDQSSNLYATADKDAVHLCYTSAGAGQTQIQHLREKWTDIK